MRSKYVVTLVLVVVCVFGSVFTSSAADKIVLKIWKGGMDEPWRVYYREAIERYKAVNPDVDVEFTDIPWPDYQAKMSAAFASRTAPDILANAIAIQARRAVLEQIIPLDEYINSWPEKDQIMERVWQAGTYRGKIYGIGYHWDPRVLVWRKDFFKEAGLDPERGPQSWEELAEYAEKLVVRDGDRVIRSGFDIPIGAGVPNFLMIFVKGNGGMLVDEVKEVPVFNEEPETLEALTFIKSLYDKNVTIEHEHNKASTIPFMSAKSAMSFLTPSMIKAFVNSFPELEDQLGYQAYIPRKAKAQFGGLYQWFISAQSPHKDEAWKFITFLLSKEETWHRYEVAANVIVRKDLYEQYASADPLNGVLWEAASISSALPNVPWNIIYLKWIGNAYEAVLIDDEDPQKALNEARAELDKEIAKQDFLR